MSNDQLEEKGQLSDDDLNPIDKFRKEHGTAVLTVLFTDLKGSTDLAEQKGESYAQAVRQKHDEMLKEIIIRDGGGTIIKNIGDSLMCVFAEPTTAVDRSVEIQEMLINYAKENPDDEPIDVRIGMHMGQVSVEGDVSADVFGRHVNRAARIEGLADAGQILMTDPVADSAMGWLNERGLTWQDHGRFRLKGIPEPTRVFEVCAPSCDGPRPPRGSQVKDRRWVLWTAALVLVAGLGVAGYVMRPRQEALTTKLNIRVMRDGDVMTSLQDALPLKTGDQLQMVGELSRPAYCCLVWVDTEGVVEIPAQSLDKPVKQLAFPPGEDQWANLTGGPGTELCFLFAKEEPFDMEELKADLGLPISSMENAGAIFIDSAQIAHVSASEEHLEERPRGLGEIIEKESDKPEYQTDKLRQKLAEKLSSFTGVAFTHDPSW